ncbi:hypothetical protein PF003_g17408 [Phytophthora fragariae]|nr:hypothetical protein PF003_g17408 [Phytophthora fragariae]
MAVVQQQLGSAWRQHKLDHTGVDVVLLLSSTAFTSCPRPAASSVSGSNSTSRFGVLGGSSAATSSSSVLVTSSSSSAPR